MTLVALAIAIWLVAWFANARLARSGASGARYAVPTLFGITVLIMWELIVRGLEVSPIILPTPTAIGVRFADSLGTLWVDFVQTVLKGALTGYAMGCGAAVLAAIAIDRSPFLTRGLLPVGNFLAALPIVGVAPIMVMWFGFDWQSKAAVVVAMVFFPMLVNTVAGLKAADTMQRDLMRTYAASYGGDAVHLQRPQDRHHAGADRRHRG